MLQLCVLSGYQLASTVLRLHVPLKQDKHTAGQGEGVI